MLYFKTTPTAEEMLTVEPLALNCLPLLQLLSAIHWEKTTCTHWPPVSPFLHPFFFLFFPFIPFGLSVCVCVCCWRKRNKVGVSGSSHIATSRNKKAHGQTLVGRLTRQLESLRNAQRVRSFCPMKTCCNVVFLKSR